MFVPNSELCVENPFHNHVLRVEKVVLVVVDTYLEIIISHNCK